jgi:hypothetical protein
MIWIQLDLIDEKMFGRFLQGESHLKKSRKDDNDFVDDGISSI